VSADFLASDVCYQEQMQRAFGTAKAGRGAGAPDPGAACRRDECPVYASADGADKWEGSDAVEQSGCGMEAITEGIRCVLEGKPLPVIQEQKEVAKYTAENQQASYGQTIGEHNEIHQHYYLPTSPLSFHSNTRETSVDGAYARNPFFTGRDAVLDDLYQRFQARASTSCVATTDHEWTRWYRQNTDCGGACVSPPARVSAGVVGQCGDGRNCSRLAYTQIATKLDLPEKEAKDKKIVVEAVKQWLQEHQQWLLILDNADEPEVLESFLSPVVGGHVLVTTRASDLTTLGLGFVHGLEIENVHSRTGSALPAASSGTAGPGCCR